MKKILYIITAICVCVASSFVPVFAAQKNEDINSIEDGSNTQTFDAYFDLEGGTTYTTEKVYSAHIYFEYYKPSGTSSSLELDKYVWDPAQLRYVEREAQKASISNDEVYVDFKVTNKSNVDVKYKLEWLANADSSYNIVSEKYLCTEYSEETEPDDYQNCVETHKLPYTSEGLAAPTLNKDDANGYNATFFVDKQKTKQRTDGKLVIDASKFNSQDVAEITENIYFNNYISHWDEHQRVIKVSLKNNADISNLVTKLGTYTITLLESSE